MAIAVYGRLDDLLRERGLTIADLQHQIEQQFGLAVDAEALRRLTGPDAAHQADLTVAAAATRTLGVGLDDLFTVDAGTAEDDLSVMQAYVGDPAPGQIRALLDLQIERELNENEQRELKALVEARTARTQAIFARLGNDPDRCRAFLARAERLRTSASS
jgi:hypothetical protein